MQNLCLAPKPSFEIVRCLIQEDLTLLFLCDNLCTYPLNYVHKSNWGLWSSFLLGIKAKRIVFPCRDRKSVERERV